MYTKKLKQSIDLTHIQYFQNSCLVITNLKNNNLITIG